MYIKAVVVLLLTLVVCATSRLSIRLEAPDIVAITEPNSGTADVLYQVVADSADDEWSDTLKVCIFGEYLGTTSAIEDLGPYCFTNPADTLKMQGMGIGSYHLAGAVMQENASHDQRTAVTHSEAAFVSIDVVEQVPFVASYDFQHVYPWQAVPPGLEIILPLDGSGKREARIPPRWQLTLYIEPPTHLQPAPIITQSRSIEEHNDNKLIVDDSEIQRLEATTEDTLPAIKAYNSGFFFRTDVTYGTTAREILEKLAVHKKLGSAVGCDISWEYDGAPLTGAETVGELDLFNNVKDLVPIFTCT